MYLFLRWLLNAVTLIGAAYLVTGIEVSGIYAAFITALILGLINAIIRPIIILLTLPINIISLGLFTFIINALMIWFVSTIVKGFNVSGFMPALWGAIILWIVSLITNFFLKK